MLFLTPQSDYGYDQRVEVHTSDGMVRTRNVPETTVEIGNEKGIHACNPTAGMERYDRAYNEEVRHQFFLLLWGLLMINSDGSLCCRYSRGRAGSGFCCGCGDGRCCCRSRKVVNVGWRPRQIAILNGSNFLKKEALWCQSVSMSFFPSCQLLLPTDGQT